ncbi:twinkle mtDNA helicase-like [Daphnia carinata]|uniref:twinkle mtDNA helicase-like n=1 Tax=Daphnia carinata TaxID=120202 RepID=UPI00257E4047|nr:twinkle mtDNA helicase-like [Daphnia carinata]
MNAVCKAHFQSLNYSRKLVVNRMKREPTRFGRISSFNNQVLLLPSSHMSFSKLNVPSSATTRRLHVLADEDRYDVSSTEIRRVIKSHFGGYQEGFTCVTVNCPSCNTLSSTTKEASNDLGKLHINLRTGYSFCTRCFLSGPWSSLASYMKALGVSKLKSEKTKTCPPSITQHLSQYTPTTAETNEMRRLWNSAQPIHSLSEETLVPFLDKLRLGDVSMETLEKVGAKINLNLEQLILPCLTSKDAPFHSIKIITPNHNQLEAIEPDPDTELDDYCRVEEKNIPKQHPWLLGYHLAKNKDEVIVTATAADTLTALDCLAVPAVCLPSGISNLPLATLAFLESFRKITLWLDNGVQGAESARVFARKLGEKRCHFIRSSEETPSALQCRMKGKNVAQVLKTALPMTHKSVTTFSSLRKDVYAEITQSSTVAGIRWRRFPALTDLLKGHRRGELTVFTGPTGAGKTTFLSEYSLDLCIQDVRTLWGSFEIRNVRLAKMMLQQFSGLMLESETREMFNVVADEFEKLPMYFLAFHGQQDVTSVLEAMSHAVYVHDISHVVIDNLQFMMGTSSSEHSSMDRFYKQDQIIGSFRRFATDNNVHITLVIHPRKEVDELSTSSIFGGAKASQEADNILILQDKRTHDPTCRRKYLEVAKNRYTGDLGVMPLEFHKESLSFAPRNKRSASTKVTAAATTAAANKVSPFTSSALQSGRGRAQ